MHCRFSETMLFTYSVGFYYNYYYQNWQSWKTKYYKISEATPQTAPPLTPLNKQPLH